jgi:hypothetical protein
MTNRRDTLNSLHIYSLYISPHTLHTLHTLLTPHTLLTLHTHFLFLIISHTNTGAPINDVTIPTGISAGEITVLAIVSDKRRNIAPSIIEHGTAYL